MVEHFAAAGLVDPRRVGVYGWSYGGYMSALCLAKCPDTFHAAVAGAMVTNWDGYAPHTTRPVPILLLFDCCSYSLMAGTTRTTRSGTCPRRPSTPTGTSAVR
jgi:dienelactone hydrolase